MLWKNGVRGEAVMEQLKNESETELQNQSEAEMRDEKYMKEALKQGPKKHMP